MNSHIVRSEIRIYSSYPLRREDSGTFFTPKITIRQLKELMRQTLFILSVKKPLSEVSISHQYKFNTKGKQQPALKTESNEKVSALLSYTQIPLSGRDLLNEL